MRKKGYVSFEIMVVCFAILTAGITGIAHFWTDGKSNQSAMVEKQEEVYYAAWNGNQGETGGNIGGDTNNDSATFVVNEDVIVIDYALPINVDVLDNDFLGASVQLAGIGSKDKKPTEESTNALADGFKNEIITNFGEAKIKDNKIVYNLKNMSMNDVDDFVYAIEYSYYDDGMKTEYYYGDVSIVPASTLYYEAELLGDELILFTTGEDWSVIGNNNHTIQDDGKIGSNLYGYDSHYMTNTLYSNGSSLFVEGQGIKLNANTAKYTYSRFSFTGTGFDLIGRTGAEQGGLRVEVYSDANYTNKIKSLTVLNKNENLELYQIPVASINDLPYGTYYVSVGVNAAYTNVNYPQLCRGGEFYFDALRIYNPAGIEPTNPFIKEVYIRDDEAYPLHTDIRDVTNDALAGIDTTSEQGKGFINENSLLPNNEIYLYPGQFIAFRVNVNAYKNVEGDNILSSVQLGIKLLTGDSNSYEIYNVTDSSIIANKYNKTIDTKADMNYDLTNLKDNIIVVRNTGNEIISLTKLKTTFITNPADLLITEPPIIVSINDIRKVINVIE